MKRFLHWQKSIPRFLRTPFLLSFLCTCVVFLSFLIFYVILQPVVPIFYSLSQPENYLAPKEWLLVFPVTSFLITFVHLYLLHYLRQYEKVIQQLFAWMTVLMQVLLMIAFFRIIFIVS